MSIVTENIKPKSIISAEEAIKVLFSKVSVFTAFGVPEDIREWDKIEENSHFDVMHADLLNKRLKVFAFAANQAIKLSGDSNWFEDARDDVLKAHTVLAGHADDGFTLQNLISRTQTLDNLLVDLISQID